MEYFKALFLSGTILIASSVDAATSKYEVQTPTTVTPYQFPGLDLNNVEGIKLTTSTTSSNLDYSIDRLEIEFPNANNLVVSNLKLSPNSPSYYGVVNNGYVFRKLIVDVNITSANPVSGDNIDVRVFVANNNDFNNDFAQPPQGEMLLETHGTIVDVTTNPIADTHWMKVDSEGLNMRLYQRAEYNPTASIPGNGFKLYMNWMGHGEQTVYLNTPFAPQDYSRFKAIALNVITTSVPEGDAYFLEVEYEDESGMRQIAPAGDLQMILNQAYQL